MTLRATAFGDVERLGDIVASQAEYVAAVAAMGALNSTMAAAPAAVQDQYRSQVNSLLDTWNAYETSLRAGWFGTANPFALARSVELGRQAEVLTRAIAAESGQAFVGNPTLEPSDKLGDLVKLAAVGVGLYGLKVAVDAWQGRRKS